MYVTNDIEKWRYDTFWTKEPETIEWIKSFKRKSVFFDIGANIGVYSLYAASLYPKMQIYAFEPVIHNFIRLIENIILNKFKNITPIPLALNNTTGCKNLYIPDIAIGSSGSQLEYTLNMKTQFTMTSQLDELLIILPMPSYIKIDVDGNEFNIIRGFTYLINYLIEGVLIEINQHRDGVMGLMIDNNFTDNNRFNKLKNHSRVRRAKEGIKSENIIFTRKING